MPAMWETCDTCEQLRNELQAAVVDDVTADANRKAFLPNTPFGPEDAKRSEELRLADEKAGERHDEAYRRYSEHRLTAHA